MHWILDAAIAFLALGIIEAVVKPLAQHFVQRRLRAALPALFSAVDPLMPRLLEHYEPGHLEAIVRSKLTEITGDDWSTKDVDLFFQLYDPRKNAERLTSYLR
jgi:hypothetical protein